MSEIKKPNLSVMDIYPEMLQDAYGLCEAILSDYGYTEKEFFRNFDDALEEYDLDNLSNRLVDVMFNVAKRMIEYSNPDEDVDYYVNGLDDTHFYINGEQM